MDRAISAYNQQSSTTNTPALTTIACLDHSKSDGSCLFLTQQKYFLSDLEMKSVTKEFEGMVRSCMNMCVDMLIKRMML